jgi:hypothetical protein
MIASAKADGGNMLKVLRTLARQADLQRVAAGEQGPLRQR